MIIDEAIRHLKVEANSLQKKGWVTRARAFRLGAEGLEVIKEFRTGRYKTINSPLLGETRN